ncbi:MAG: hypothetical protein MRY83_06560 [Flavobacteriales bacterium]|nr:hypothetical protein [Flavobacteriales bacterium]
MLLFACGDPVKKDEVQNNTPIDLNTEENDFPLVLPSPLQVASLFKKSGLIYIDGVTNDPENHANYETFMYKSMNFGIYGADLSYCVLNNQNQQAMTYLKTIRKMSDELGITRIFDAEDMFERFNANLGNEDSLIDVLASVQQKLDDHLEENESEYLAAIYFAGGWVESVYLGIKNLEQKKEEKLLNRMVEQMGFLDMIIKGFELNPNKTEEFNSIFSDLKEIKDVYNSFEAIKKLSEDEVDLTKFTISDEEYNKISQKVIALRTKLIENN